MNIEEIYKQKCDEPSDINEHLPTLRAYASLCEHVTEFGVRSIVSTWALIAGRPKIVISYDLTSPGQEALTNAYKTAKESGVTFIFICEDVLKTEIVQTDMLFIDTFHTYTQLKAELMLHANKVLKFILLHDTAVFGNAGEANNEKGLLPAIAEFVSANQNWVIREVFVNNNGLMVLERI